MSRRVAQQNHKTVLMNQRTKLSLLNNRLCISLSTHQEISVDFVVGMSKEVVRIEMINKLTNKQFIKDQLSMEYCVFH